MIGRCASCPSVLLNPLKETLCPSTNYCPLKVFFWTSEVNIIQWVCMILFYTLYKLGSSVDCPNEKHCKVEIYSLYMTVQLYTLDYFLPC